MIDGKSIKDYNVKELRSQIGIVMQEPILFNMTIKDNILYGNDTASDEKVYEAAEMANAIQFIESNIEDLEEKEAQKHIENNYRKRITGLSQESPSFNKLWNEYELKNLTLDEIKMIDNILRKMDEKLKSTIAENVDGFISIVKKNSATKGIRWDDLVRKLEWTYGEYKEIQEYISKLTIGDKMRKTIDVALQRYEGRIDLNAVKSYVEELEVLEKDEDANHILGRILAESSERINHA